MEGLFTTFMEIGLECFNSHGVLMLSPGAPSPNPCYTNLSWFTSLLWAGSFHLPAVMSCHFSFSRIFLLLLLSLFLIFFCVSLFSSVVSRERNGILIPTIAYFCKRNKEHEFRLRLRISFLLGIEIIIWSHLSYVQNLKWKYTYRKLVTSQPFYCVVYPNSDVKLRRTCTLPGLMTMRDSSRGWISNPTQAECGYCR